MSKHLLITLSLLAVLGNRPAAAIDQTIWLDASDPSTLVLNGNVVDAWRDRTPHHNDLLRIQGTPLAANGGIELVERFSGLTDRLEGSAILSPRREAFLMFLVCRAYSQAVRVFSFGGNNMSVLQQGSFGDDILGLQIDNNCLLAYPNAGIGGAQVYVMTRVPNGTGSDVTFQRFGGPELSATVPCGPEELSLLRFDNGSGSFPTNSLKGMTVFEVRAFTASVTPASSSNALTSSPFDAGFIQATLDELGVKWNVNQPIPVQSTTWGRIKLLGR